MLASEMNPEIGELLSFSDARESMEEFACLVNNAGWQLDYCQLTPDLSPSSMNFIASPNVEINRFKVGSRLHHRIATPRDMYTFALLTGEQRSSWVDGRELRPGDLLFAHSDHGIDAVNDAGFDAFVVNVSKEQMRTLADCHGLGLPEGAGTERELSSANVLALEGLLTGIQCPVGHDPQWHQRELIDTELPLALLSAWNGTIPAPDSGASSRMRACNRAVEYIRSAGGNVRSVQQICDAAAASYSTLERAFRERFGLSPKQYLVQFRMAGVRRELLADGHERSITEIAHEWGFYHMGKFAADYQAAFGELPSQTLAA